MFVMDVPPEVPPQYAPVVIAQTTQAETDNATADRTLGVCHLATNVQEYSHSAVNSFGTVAVAYDYLKLVEKRDVQLSGTVEILSEPTHGKLERIAGTTAYFYIPESNYEGQDKATFLVKIGGHKVKLHYFFNVQHTMWGGTDGYDPYDDKQFCPKGGMWRISFNPDDPTAPVYTFAPPFVLARALAGTGVNLTLTDGPAG